MTLLRALCLVPLLAVVLIVLTLGALWIAGALLVDGLRARFAERAEADDWKAMAALVAFFLLVLVGL